jgi:hypothetical protein
MMKIISFLIAFVTYVTRLSRLIQEICRINLIYDEEYGCLG